MYIPLLNSSSKEAPSLRLSLTHPLLWVIVGCCEQGQTHSKRTLKLKCGLQGWKLGVGGVKNLVSFVGSYCSTHGPPEFTETKKGPNSTCQTLTCFLFDAALRAAVFPSARALTPSRLLASTTPLVSEVKYKPRRFGVLCQG